ncbi:MAG: AMP-binding protein, partial [Actinomycetota bacterium]|nr:AMP-binding protein [Actinomycetota bacterium]
MYLDQHAIKNPDRAAIIMASTGKTISFSEFEARANQLAHVLRNEGLQRLDHYSIFMEIYEWYLESCAAGERAGSYYTCVNSFLTAEELAYILSNSRSELLVTSTSKVHLALEALDGAPNVRKVFVCGGVPSDISD